MTLPANFNLPPSVLSRDLSYDTRECPVCAEEVEVEKGCCAECGHPFYYERNN
jgi:predicted amidophosphoribosyltransferase